MTPEQKAEADRQRLASNKRDFTRLVLGMFGASLAAAPLEFVFAGQAEAPDGKADVLDVRGTDGFAVRLFVDAATHLPLMVTWTDKEPLILQAGPGGTAVTAGGGGAMFQSAGGGAIAAAGGHGAATGSAPTRMTPEELQKMEKDLEARRAEAEAKRRTVEYRIYYSDYQVVGGVKLPHRVQRSIDGKTTEEMLFESYKVNARIDQGTFKPSK